MYTDVTFRYAAREDCELILQFIQALADYEHMSQEVVATAELLEEWIFDRQKAEVLFAVADGKEVGFALFFHNYDHSFPLRYKAQKGMKPIWLYRSIQ